MKKKKFKEFICRCITLTTILCFCLLWPTIFGVLGAKDVVPYKIGHNEDSLYSQEG